MPVGRRSVLTQTVIDKICEARGIGATWLICAQYAGIAEASIMYWLSAARDLQAKIDDGLDPASLDEHDTRILEFSRKATRAEATDAINLLQVVDKAAAIDPAWAWKRLQQRYPEYMPVQRNELTGKDGGPVEMTAMTLDEWKKQRAKNKAQAAETLAAFDEKVEDEDEGEDA